MSAVIPESSDTFKLLCAKGANAVDYGADLIRTFDRLQRFAMDHGLVEKLGQDTIQRMMSEAIKPVRNKQR